MNTIFEPLCAFNKVVGQFSLNKKEVFLSDIARNLGVLL